MCLPPARCRRGTRYPSAPRAFTQPHRKDTPERFKAHWAEMLQCLDARPDQTAVELLTEFQARYPGFYSGSHLRTMRRRLQVWRRQAIQRLICEMWDFTQDVGSGAAA